MSAITQKILQFQFVLGEGQFGANDTQVSGQFQTGLGNTVKLPADGQPPLRAIAHIEGGGGGVMPTAHLEIYGVPETIMNQLSTLGQIATTVRRNSVSISAGDVGGPLSLVFVGTIQNAYGDYSQEPNVPFIVDAFGLLADAIAPSTPISFTGKVQVATLLAQLASQMNLSFENNNVTVAINNPYYPQSPRVAARKIVEDAGIEWNSGEGGVLAIWNPGQSRQHTVPTIKPASEGGTMVKYPSFFSLGIMFKSLFNPQILFGNRINMQSSLTPANGQWVVSRLTHDLESQVPGGRWESTVECAPVGYGPIAPTKG